MCSPCPSPAATYGISDLEYKIIQDQMARRYQLRQQFLKARSDPCKHSLESGYVFDPAIQRFLSMKTTQLEYFQVNPKSIAIGATTIILPMIVFGYGIWRIRTNREIEIRCGRLLYRDRLFKLK